MRLTEALDLALGSMKTGKLRSMLTLLGIIIGIMSVITILTLGHALKTQTLGSLDSLGLNNLQVQVQNRKAAEDSQSDYFFGGAEVKDAGSLITASQVSGVRERFGDKITGVSYSGHAGGLGDVETSMDTLAPPTVKAAVSPVNEDYLRLSGIQITSGRGITEQDVTEGRHVAIISPKLLSDLFKDDVDRALGSEVRFRNDAGTASFIVIGVSGEQKGGLLVGSSKQATLYVPYPIQQLFPRDDGVPLVENAYSEVSFRVAQGVDKGAVRDELQTYFDRAYQGNNQYMAKVVDNKKDMESINQVLNSISLAVAAIGGISLLVGGIGVMNVMLITVTERTREIGVRKALGARRRDIKVQFIIEAMIVCLIGGLIGVVLGAVFGMIGATMLGQFVFPPPAAVIISLLFCMGIGLFFGYYPAAKAAKMNPIEALRYE
ncbi:ABC transporter permease [Corynebacterium hindlerae]|uniref:ABC transporter permease n=1 Tax=Corynebacterium hindlerae TaxID=699041 RepID=UPI001AD713D0|nr:ABC transporter permease [Corynebacterium hindlerae]QTH60638.1 ABC transporter permease [Corynebacterium hindlerae]